MGSSSATSGMVLSKMCGHWTIVLTAFDSVPIDRPNPPGTKADYNATLSSKPR